MAKNRRKVVFTVTRRKDTLNMHVPNVQDNDVVLALQATSTQIIIVPASSLPSPPKISDGCTDDPFPILELGSSSQGLEDVTVEECLEDDVLVEALLEDEQVNFSYFDDEYVASPKSASVSSPTTTMVPPHVASDDTLLATTITSRNPSSSSPRNRVWTNLFTTKKQPTPCTKLQNFSLNHLTKTCDISSEDIQSQFEVWNLCAIGYIYGKSPGYRALNGIISSI